MRGVFMFISSSDSRQSRETNDQENESHNIVQDETIKTLKGLMASADSPLSAIQACENLRRLNAAYVNLARFDKTSESSNQFALQVGAVIFTIVEAAHDQMSDEQIIEQLAHMPVPRDRSDIALALKLYEKVKTHGETALQSLGKWVSSSHLPLVDLQRPFKEIVTLAPYLETLNFTPSHQNQLISEEISKIIEAAPQTKKIIFYFNHIDSDIAEKLLKCRELEKLSITKGKVEKGVQLSLLFPKLSVLTIDRLADLDQNIDLRSSVVLTSFALEGCPTFNHPILFAPEAPIEYFRIHNCQSWNQPLDGSHFKKLKRFALSLNEAFNHPIDLTRALNIESIDIIACLHWNSPLFLPKSEELGSVSLDDDRDFNQPLSFEANPRLTSINLTNCRSFNSTLALPRGFEREHLILQNCPISEKLIS